MVRIQNKKNTEIARDRVNHLDSIHQCREDINDRINISIVERIEKSLQRRQVLDIVLGLVGRFGDLDIDFSPLS